MGKKLRKLRRKGLEGFVFLNTKSSSFGELKNCVGGGGGGFVGFI